jgi:hypothetical protein
LPFVRFAAGHLSCSYQEPVQRGSGTTHGPEPERVFRRLDQEEVVSRGATTRPRCRIAASIESRSAAAANDVVDSSHASVLVQVVVTGEHQVDAVPLKERYPCLLDAPVAAVDGAHRIRRMVKRHHGKGSVEPSKGSRQPPPLHGIRPAIRVEHDNLHTAGRPPVPPPGRPEYSGRRTSGEVVIPPCGNPPMPLPRDEAPFRVGVIALGGDPVRAIEVVTRRDDGRERTVTPDEAHPATHRPLCLGSRSPVALHGEDDPG